MKSFSTPRMESKYWASKFANCSYPIYCGAARRIIITSLKRRMIYFSSQKDLCCLGKTTSSQLCRYGSAIAFGRTIFHVLFIGRIIWVWTKQREVYILSSVQLCFQSHFSLASTDTSKSPRGIRGFQLNTGTFSEWKIQGKVGGYTKSVSRSSLSLANLILVI